MRLWHDESVARWQGRAAIGKRANFCTHLTAELVSIAGVYWLSINPGRIFLRQSGAPVPSTQTL